ncbi:hypothetical protein LTR17_002686 [Elasticomyces elasticus]|nr:hypothetical protein LTR17_002686 [Elasticomyces elasticus]
MTQSAEASISGLREQIKDNAAMLFPDQVQNYQHYDRRVPAVGVFAVVVEKEAGLYTAYLAYNDHGLKNAASGGRTSNVVDALHSLLDVLALGLAKSRKASIMDKRAKWVESGDGEMMDGLEL